MDLQTYLRLDATAMAELVRKKEVKPIELLQNSFKQLEKVNKDLNAVTHLRQEKVMEEAENDRFAGGFFAGVPFFLKDTQELAGEKSTVGARLLQHNIPRYDANIVKKYREAGLLFMGITTTPEFALKNITEPELYGPTRNPWNLDYSPGGSSGGSAALVASGVVPMAGASDGGGSIRIPASFSSLFGLKPTRGRTPVGPGVGRQWHGAAIDFILSRSVRDSAAMLDELQVIQPEAAFQTPLYEKSYTELLNQSFSQPLKIAFTTKSPVDTPVSKDAVIAVERVATWLADQGHHVVEQDDNGVDGNQLIMNYFLMNSGEISSLMQRLERSFGREITADDVEIETWVLNEVGKRVTAAEFSQSLLAWDVAAWQMARFHEQYDFYITPATAYPAPKIGELTPTKERREELLQNLAKDGPKPALINEMFLPSLTYTPFSQLANLTGQPAMSVPVYLTEEGLPLGVQVIAPKGEEHRLLQLASLIEQSELWVGMKGNPYFRNID